MLFYFHLSNQKIVGSSAPERCLRQGWQLGFPVREEAWEEHVCFSRRPDLLPLRLKRLNVLLNGSVNQNIAI